VLVRRIQQTFEAPFAVGDQQLALTASVGIAFAGPGAKVTEDLVTEADRAMYDVNRRGGGGRVADLHEGDARVARG
jgi:GGDEF domain-containing protein